MRVAVIGHGSIGRRHAEILCSLGHQVVVFDSAPEVALAAGAQRAETFDAALAAAEAAVIASPSSLHAGQTRTVLLRSIPVLVEKPLALDVAQATELEHLAHKQGVFLAVGMNLRHHAGVLALREVLMSGKVGRVLGCRAWCESWLPGWRPGTDYRAAYSARAALGGGVLLDVAVHELDYLLWLLGPALSVSALVRRVSSLEIDVEDLAYIELEFAGGAVAHLAANYLDRSYHRGCRVTGEEGSVHWSWEENRITVAAGGHTRLSHVTGGVAAAYHRQMECFIAATQGDERDLAGPTDARAVLEVIDAARSSSATGRRISLPPEVSLRAANEDDSRLILAWRNDPDARRWSRTTHEVGPEEHRRWLEGNLAHPGSRIWLGQAESRPIGQIRAARGEGGTVELHVTVAPEARGRGYGTSLINQASAQILSDPSVRRLIAYVHRDNGASARAFVRAGFSPTEAGEREFRLFERSPLGLV